MTEDVTLNHSARPRWLRIFVVPLVAAVTVALLFPIANDTPLATTIYAALSLALAAMSGLLLGTANHWARFIVAPFVILLTGLSLGFMTGSRTFDWLGALIPALITIVIFATLEISKLIAGRFHVPDADAEFEEAFQFRIAHLMIVTAAIAVFISVVKWSISFVDTDPVVGSPNTAMILAIFVGTHVVITLSNLWALMGTRVSYRLAIATAVSFVSMITVSLAPNGSMVWMWLTVFVVSWLAIVIQLSILRFEGIRFVRRSA